MEAISKPTDRISGLDSIRFLCALCVFFFHQAVPMTAGPSVEGAYADPTFSGFLNNFLVGPPAVIVFFIVSGFCIHYPFAGSNRRPRWMEFYTRRFVRLLVPIIVAVPLSELVGVHLAAFHDSILWSLLAELIYYVLYPFLRAAQLRFGSWHGMVLAAFGAAFVVAATHPAALDYPSYGRNLNWLLGLPCWLLGCLLAESVRAAATGGISTTRLWAWRTAVFGAALACNVLRFHGYVGFPWTLDLFAVVAALWLRREITFRRRVPAPALFEWAGLWSYSLYILHLPAGALFSRLFPSTHYTPLHWCGLVLFVLSTCYAFYLLVERPSHFLARTAPRKVRLVAETVLSILRPDYAAQRAAS